LLHLLDDGELVKKEKRIGVKENQGPEGRASSAWISKVVWRCVEVLRARACGRGRPNLEARQWRCAWGISA
jgi:hypothetical protein